MRALRSIETGWLRVWWDDGYPDPERSSGEEIVSLDMTADEFMAEAKSESGLDEIAGVYLEETGEASPVQAEIAIAPKGGKKGRPREIPRGEAKLRALPPAAREAEETAPELSMLSEYAGRKRKRNNESITFGDLEEMARMVESGEIGKERDG